MRNDSSAHESENLNNVIKIDESQFKSHLGDMVRSTVEETLNAMLDAEADLLAVWGRQAEIWSISFSRGLSKLV